MFLASLCPNWSETVALLRSAVDRLHPLVGQNLRYLLF